MILFAYAFVMLFAVIFLIRLVFTGSALIIRFAPFSMAALLGLSYGWIAFFLSLVILFSLYSYDGLRRSIVGVSICMAGCVIVTVLSMLLLESRIENLVTLGFVRFVIGIVCLALALYHDGRNDDAVCIPLSSYLKIPTWLQRILSSAIYSFGLLFLFTLSFHKAIQGGFFESILFQWIFFIVCGVAAYFLQGVVGTQSKTAM